MIKKIFRNIERDFEENLKEIIFALSFFVLCTNPLPYYILVSGGTLDVNDKVSIEDEYDVDGSFNLAYVNQLKATLPTYIIAKFNKNWTLYSTYEMTGSEDEGDEEISFRDELDLYDSEQSAVKVAYDTAGKTFNIKDSFYYVYYVTENVKKYTDIKTGDKVISINGVNISSLDYYREVTKNTEVGDTVKVGFKRGKKEFSVDLKVYEEDGTHYTGLGIVPKRVYTTDPEIEFNFSDDEGGPSGGLTLSLAIYNKLVKEDITHGLKIVGTGTIDENGNVGMIGGVKYKLKGAIKAKADVFIVPDGNYKEVKEIMDKKHYDIKIIHVSSFAEALEELEKLGD